MLVARVQASSPMRRRVVGCGAWHDKGRQESQRLTMGFTCLIGLQAGMGKTHRNVHGWPRNSAGRWRIMSMWDPPVSRPQQLGSVPVMELALFPHE